MPSTEKATGFTLIELLVVIAIISLLSSVVLASLSGAREEARKSAARAELNSLRTGIEMLINDTNKWPNGCPLGAISNPEINLNNSNAGLVSAPTAGDQGDGCVWTSSDVQEWDGPYVNSDELVDPWGRDYYFDPDYWPYRDCDTKAQEPVIVAIFSIGPDGDLSGYDCDEVYINLE